jgi:hypothetical protein
MIEGGKKLEIQLTVEDPDTFNQAWKTVRRFRRSDEPEFMEDICAEGNFNLFDYGIPTAATPDFKRAFCAATRQVTQMRFSWAEAEVRLQP